MIHVEAKVHDGNFGREVKIEGNPLCIEDDFEALFKFLSLYPDILEIFIRSFNNNIDEELKKNDQNDSSNKS